MSHAPPSLRMLRIDTPLGDMTLAASDAGLSGAWFAGQRHWPDARGWQEAPRDALLRAAEAQLREYFAGRRQHFDLPLDFSRGTSFQQLVWRALHALPFGTTTRYGALAAALQNPRAVRAVGAAVGRNRLSVIVPCHRVLGAGGALTGYAGGLDRKRALLALERNGDG